MGEVVIWSMEEMILWWLGILAGLVCLMTLFYWIVADAHLDDEVVNEKLYNFVEKHFGKRFLEVFKKYI